jgi:hypothetical protein
MRSEFDDFRLSRKTKPIEKHEQFAAVNSILNLELSTGGVYKARLEPLSSKQNLQNVVCFFGF